jgi:hypothetical protein
MKVKGKKLASSRSVDFRLRPTCGFEGELGQSCHYPAVEKVALLAKLCITACNKNKKRGNRTCGIRQF